MKLHSRSAVLLISTLLSASSISCSSTCQEARPQQPCPPAEIVVNPKRPPCVLPHWPAPPVIGGIKERDADGKETGRLLVTRDGLAELGRFVAGAIEWAETAGECLE